MKSFKLFFSLTIFSFLFTLTPVLAQDKQDVDISDKDLEMFAEVLQEVQDLNKKAQQDMVIIVEEEGLEIKRYNEIRQAQQNPDAKMDASEDEIKKFNAATEEMVKIQDKAQKDMQKQIEAGGLTVDEYEDIARKIQSNPELQEKFQKLVEEQS